MKKQSYMLFLTLFAVAVLLPGSAAGGEIPLNYSFNESHAEIYQQMLERNASVGEYYEQVCPEFLESMPPEVRAHVYSIPLSRHLDCENGTFVPPGKRVSIGIASPVISVCGVPVALVTIGLAALGILILLAGALLVRERLRIRKE
jgi:hypothetical protein